MKKKITVTLLALVCAFGCAFGLTACGDDDEKKPHTAEQWDKAFQVVQSQTQDYFWRESYGEGKNYKELTRIEVHRDAENLSYFLTEGYPNNGEWSYKDSYLVKKGDKYYESENGEHAIQLRPEEFAQSEEKYLSYTNSIPLLFQEFQSRYEEFKKTGSGSGSSGDGETVVNFQSWVTYTLNDVTFTMQAQTQDGLKDVEYTAEEVTVEISDQTGEVCDLTVRHLSTAGEYAGQITDVDLKYQQYRDNNTLSGYLLPEVAGKTFCLMNVKVSNNAYYEMLVGNTIEVNNGKTVTCNADGTLTGNIEINGVSLSTYTYTDDYGKITVSNEKNTQVPEQSRNTLVGGINEHYEFPLELTVDIGGESVVITYVFYYQMG